MKLTKGLIAFGLLAACGCSPVMEATRPNPVDISQIVVGESRVDVVSQLGAPSASIKDGANSCDVYKLYTHGPNGVEKGAIAVGEAAADVFTLGLTEVLFTPAEAATRNSKHTVMMCYDENGHLASSRESD